MTPDAQHPLPVHATSPQIGRIARLLGIDPAEVAGLEGIPDADLRVLHDQISKRLFGDAQRQFARVAALSKSIPGPLAGVLAERFLPPVMAARVSEMLDPAKARDLIGRVSIEYLVEIALALDPVRSKPVVQKLPPEPIGKVAKALFGRGEYAAMAEFVGTVTTEALMAAFEVATPQDLLAVVPLLEWNDNLDVVVAGLPHHKVTQIATSLTPVELADLAMALDPSRMGPIVAAVPAEVVAGIARALFERGEYAGMARFVGVVTPQMLHAALGVASGRDLLAVVPLLEWNENLDRVIAELEPRQVKAIVTELNPAQLAELAMVLDPSRMGPIVASVPVGVVEGIADALFERGEYAGMARFVGVVTPEMVHAVLADLPTAHIQPMVAELTPVELADLALVLEPAVLGPLVEFVPVATVAEIARVLFERGEYPGMARFAGVVTPQMLHAALGVATAQDLVAVVPLLDWDDRIDAVVDSLPDETLDALFAEIAGSEDRETARAAFERLSATAQQRLFDRFDRLSTANQAVIRAAAEGGDLGPVAAALLAGTSA